MSVAYGGVAIGQRVGTWMVSWYGLNVPVHVVEPVVGCVQPIDGVYER